MVWKETVRFSLGVSSTTLNVFREYLWWLLQSQNNLPYLMFGAKIYDVVRFKYYKFLSESMSTKLYP